MTGRRKDMWKLLYNLVNRNKANLSAVYHVVDDILCQDPSLISCSSMDELQNEFQDIFLLWLLNKLSVCLNECKDEGQCLKNVQLQQKLLTSCWCNHPKLYKGLLAAYLDALQQLHDLMSAFDYTSPGKNDKEARLLHLRIFRGDISVLQEFDTDCSFEVISVQLEHSDALAKYLLLVLQHAHHIAHATHGKQFVESLQQALLCIKEFNMDTKLTALGYCHAVLKAQTEHTWQTQPEVAHYACLTLRATSMLWSLCSRFLAAQCMTSQHMDLLANHTEQLLELLQPQQLPDPESLELSCQMLHELLRHKQDNAWGASLLEALSVYLQHKLQQSGENQQLPSQTTRLLLCEWQRLPNELLPLLAVLAVHNKAVSDLILGNLNLRLLELLQKPSHGEITLLLPLMRALKQMEQLLLLQQQQEVVKISTEALHSQLLASLPLQHELQLPMAANWNQLCLQLLEQPQCSSASAQLVEISAQMLQLNCIRLQLKPHTQQQLLGMTLQQPLPALQALSTLRLETPSSAHTQLQSYYMQQHLRLLNEEHLELRQRFCAQLPQLYVAGYIKAAQLLQALPRLKIRDDGADDDSLASVLRLLLCTQQAGDAHVFQVEQRIVLHCAKCAPLPAELPGIYLGCCRSSGLKLNVANLPDLAAAVMFKPKCGFISHHLDLIQLEPTHCLRLLKESSNPQSLNLRSFERLVPVLSAQCSDFMLQLGKHVLASIVNMLGKPLEAQRESEQRFWLRLIVCSAHQQLDELWLFHWFKMTFYLLVHTRSLVAQEAVLASCQLCANHGLQPLTLWNWYKRDAVALVVQLALHAYLNEGVRFTRSLRALSKMLGFSCVQEFICKYHRLLTTLVLPYCIREPRCKGVFVLMSKQLGKPISALFSISFLRLYTHVYLTEQPEIANRCIELVASCTKSSLQQLMNADVKQTVAELLIYFNRNPTFVMRSFQSLLQLTLGAEEELSSQAVNAQFATFIAERILGVITYFESCLSEPSFEKLLKEETLLSLGQILRFVGPQHVTQFRFKIIAMLSFVHTLKEPQLQRICLNIWHIFLHVVNIQELGPSLGRIVATLQPLLEYSVEQVNELYEFVILRNAAMLGNYIQDLYFLENLEQVSTPIRDCIRRHTAQLCLAGPAAGQEETTPLLDQLRFLHKQISNECLQVRVYGLEHLAELFGRRRQQLNQMLLNALPLEPLMEQLVHTLMSGCQHDDRSLQLASAKCMGQLGAIDASYLPSNYNFATAQALPLSVLTDDFTVLALTALCSGYQSQQQTKHVDSFALAIQETLAVCGIVPKEQKKLQLWQSLPQRMREIMEPLLSSCYICSNRPNTLKQQPLFGSHYTANSYELWAYLWATRLVDYVQSAQTRHLLSSYKPCIRRDTNMLSTFYPYIVLHALLECNAEQRLHIEQEFQAVLQANDELSQQQQQTKTTSEQGVKIFESRKYGAGNRSTMEQPESASKPEDQSRLAGKLCAELLDFLERWLREWQRLHGMSTSGKPPQDVDSSYKAIYEFMQSMDKLQVARASYNCGEYERALRYLEAYIAAGDKSQLLLEQFTFLVEIYGRLMDADSVEGAVQTRSCDMSVTQEILVNRLVERQQDMITCYEQLLTSNEQLQPTHIRAMVDAYLRMDTPKTALLIADGLAQRLSDQRMDAYFSECKAELLWRLGSYDELDELEQASKRCTPNWHAQCAKACLALREETTTKLQFDGLLDSMRGSVLEQLRSCSSQQQHSYAHAYDHVLKLHMVHELQCCQLLMEQLQQQPEEQQAEQLMRDYFEDWQCRLQVVQPQLRVLEPIYSFRRNLLAELQRRLGSRATLQNQLQTQLSQIWLQSAQINRNAGQLQRAHLYLMKASAYKPTGLFVERAKLLWQKGDQVLAMNYLEEQLNTIKRQCDGNTKQLPEEQRQLYFEGKYLQATYNADSMNLCADAILKYFQEAIAVQRQSERCYVQLAQFLEKMREARGAATSSAASSSREEEELLLQIMLNYAKSLRYGNQHVYQSMPRLISLWLDTAATPSTSATYPELVRKMNDLLNNCCTALPTAMFYTAYSQMLSRLCHPSPDVFAVLRNVIIKLITDYPQQSLWMLLPHFKSAAVNRIKRCKLILTDSRLQNPTFERLLNDFNSLTERLIGVTNKEVTLDRTYKLSDLDKRLTLLCSQPNFSNILLPFEKYMQPAFSLSCTPDASSITQEKLPSSNWFPYQQIYISGFQEKLLVLRSAARPKKLTIRCSDGQDYDIMVKPKDDLRKDARLMEFNGLMKRYLHQDAHARQRRLHIRTYAVLPFNEECGLLEWLPNLNSYRSICIALYAQRGKVMSGRQLQQLAVPQMETPERKRDVFLKQLQPAHPPVFQEWLLQRFTTPHSWYEARNSYIRTVAVMSMVGYILGLGDRHGENILFDERNGDAVHVDFNCLFNQGEAFAYPEVVPFRLTHNMITAMGPLGVEGSYRKCCEITLRLLKQETKTLMSMLRPFVYDLGVQSRLTASTASKNKPGAELTDPKVTNDVKRIAERLQGHVKRQQANSIPLSTEGQVNFLINEATKVDNLAAMYIGWGAFL